MGNVYGAENLPEIWLQNSGIYIHALQGHKPKISKESRSLTPLPPAFLNRLCGLGLFPKNIFEVLNTGANKGWVKKRLILIAADEYKFSPWVWSY